MSTDINYDKEVRRWGRQLQAGALGNVQAMTNQGRQMVLRTFTFKRLWTSHVTSMKNQNMKLAVSLRMNYVKRQGDIERITMSFARHGFYIAVGARRGHKPKTNPYKKVDWYDSLVKNNMERLAQIVSDGEAKKQIRAIGAIIRSNT
jgi:hypothetical protein